jgi:hypothetical protein
VSGPLLCDSESLCQWKPALLKLAYALQQRSVALAHHRNASQRFDMLCCCAVKLPPSAHLQAGRRPC